MTNAMSITSKYQVTVPKEIRQALRLTATDSVTFNIENGKVIIEKVPTIASVQTMVQKHIKASGVSRVTDAEMKRAREIFHEKGLTWEQ